MPGYSVFVAEDPERTWAQVAPAVLHDANEYARWIRGRWEGYAEVDDAEQLRAAGTYRILTPEECLELARAEGALSFKPLVGGLDPAVGWECLELFADRVLPSLFVEAPESPSIVEGKTQSVARVLETNEAVLQRRREDPETPP